MTDDKPLPFDLTAVDRKKLTVDFNGGPQSSLPVCCCCARRSASLVCAGGLRRRCRIGARQQHSQALDRNARDAGTNRHMTRSPREKQCGEFVRRPTSIFDPRRPVSADVATRQPWRAFDRQQGNPRGDRTTTAIAARLLERRTNLPSKADDGSRTSQVGTCDRSPAAGVAGNHGSSLKRRGYVASAIEVLKRRGDGVQGWRE
jgi:hypothetical protein